MKHRLVLALATTVMIGLTLAQNGDDAQQEQQEQDERSIIEIISTHPELTTFHEILRDAGLLEAEADWLGEAGDGDREGDGEPSGEVGVTVFAPSNAAFEALGDDELEAFRADPEEALLANHVEQEPFTVEELTKTPSSEEFTLVVETDDAGNVVVNDATIVEGDLIATNGVVHIIDRILTIDADDGSQGAEGAEGDAAEGEAADEEAAEGEPADDAADGDEMADGESESAESADTEDEQDEAQ